MKKFGFAMLAGCSLIALGAVPAHAQDAAANDQAGASAQGLEDIVVTAQRRSENLQDVPIQVTAFSETKITDAGIKATRDFVALVPNLSFDESFTYLNSFVVVRGVTQINNADSPVAVIVDGVPQNNQKQLKMNLFDVERIEVLKGPQGGLYGRNAIGGAMNIITQSPGDRLEGWVSGSYGRFDDVNLTAAVSTPVGENAGLRVSGSFLRNDGNFKNIFLDEGANYIKHDWEVRGKFNWEPSATIDVDARVAYRDFNAGAVYNSAIVSNRDDDYRGPSSNMLGETFGDILDTSLKLDFDLGGVTLTSISAYTKLVENYRGDLDFSNPVDHPSGFLGRGFQAGQGQDLDLKMISQELRLVSDSKGPFRWILGAYYLHTDRDLLTRAFIDRNGSVDQINDPSLSIINRPETNDNNAYAVYANVDYDLTDSLTLSGALRYDRDDREQTNVTTGAVRKTSFDSVQPKATLTYKLMPGKLAYATYSTGFRSGGFNAPNVRIPIFNAERLENFEAGFKTRWLDNNLIVNGAVYKARSKDFQYFFVDITTASQIVANIDRVDIWGLELEVQAQPVRGLQLFGALGTTDSKIKRNDLEPATIGNHTPKTTDWSLNAGFQYKAPLTDDLSFLIRATYLHRGKKYWQVDNRDLQEPVDLIDLRAGIEGDRWSLAVIGQNITNKKYYADYSSRVYTGLAFDTGTLAQPATWAVEAKIKF